MSESLESVSINTTSAVVTDPESVFQRFVSYPCLIGSYRNDVLVSITYNFGYWVNTLTILESYFFFFDEGAFVSFGADSSLLTSSTISTETSSPASTSSSAGVFSFSCCCWAIISWRSCFAI